jgi:hypothetical protein
MAQRNITISIKSDNRNYGFTIRNVDATANNVEVSVDLPTNTPNLAQNPFLAMLQNMFNGNNIHLNHDNEPINNRRVPNNPVQPEQVANRVQPNNGDLNSNDIIVFSEITNINPPVPQSGVNNVVNAAVNAISGDRTENVGNAEHEDNTENQLCHDEHDDPDHEHEQEYHSEESEMQEDQEDLEHLEDHENEMHSDSSDPHYQEDETFKKEMQQSVINSMMNTNIREVMKNYWLSTGHLSPEYVNAIQFGNANRKTALFDELLYTHPRAEQVASQQDLNMYREVFVNFDDWIRKTMVAEQNNAKSMDVLKRVDVDFGTYLLKFPKVLDGIVFSELIDLFDKTAGSIVDPHYGNTQNIKTVLMGIRAGVIDDIIKLLDPVNCGCSTCSL